jgi:hypothetical protein
MKLLKVGLFYLCLSIIKKTQSTDNKMKSNLKKIEYANKDDFIPRNERKSRGGYEPVNFLQKKINKKNREKMGNKFNLGQAAEIISCSSKPTPKPIPPTMEFNLNIDIKNEEGCCDKPKNCKGSKHKRSKSKSPDRSPCKPDSPSRSPSPVKRPTPTPKPPGMIKPSGMIYGADLLTGISPDGDDTPNLSIVRMNENLVSTDTRADATETPYPVATGTNQFSPIFGTGAETPTSTENPLPSPILFGLLDPSISAAAISTVSEPISLIDGTIEVVDEENKDVLVSTV